MLLFVLGKLVVQPFDAFHTLFLVVKVQVHIQEFQPIAEGHIPFGIGHLFLQRLHLAVKLRNDILQPQDIFVRFFQIALGFFLAHAVFHDARRFLKNLPPRDRLTA
ncbi:hypothetical protein SDC9_159000 [bioreactor metagenome]|uniref:Uncharacterized protein n=1 Tax=bioreactor metagenome TaxID=1076179 RepID=A0A645FHF9_9ZZZZ